MFVTFGITYSFSPFFASLQEAFAAQWGAKFPSHHSQPISRRRNLGAGLLKSSYRPGGIEQLEPGKDENADVAHV